MRVTTDDGEEELSSLPDLAEDWSALCTNGVVPDVQLSDFLYSDNCAVSTEEVSDQAVVESIRDNDDGESSETTEPPVVPTAREVLDAIDVLRRVAGSQDDDRTLNAFVSFERCMLPSLARKTQGKLTDFFSTK
ncbi:hypothetical protein HPB47_010335 [Ixodes persulcatus]|uniref:Uncharacterized protein n=1 Tax=Ixodes persulcatus TaxID=34615 RepID=A0AC60NZF9_IXOPE|nr:hypothetical protein HPB47_010335 [Ixodes persulcatus]